MQGIAVSADSGRLLAGGVAGLAGGVAFGAMMQMMGMMGMVAALVGSSSAAVGWVVHLAISFGFGAGYGALVATRSLGANALLGAAWGAGLWAVAAMLVMRSIMAAPIALDAAAMQSLMGHLVFGVVTGLAYARVAPASLDEPAPQAKRSA